MSLYDIWKSKELTDTDLTAELLEIEGNEEEINERFYRYLEFGTAGIRGILGAGTNRMNVYTVAHATNGLANYLSGFDKPSVAIAYDSRIKSDLFAKTAAEVLAGKGIKVYIYDELMPTPMLSYAVRELKCDAGIVVTASHNPAKYNGYKVYGPDGCQLTDNAANAVLAEISKTDIFDVTKISFEEGIANGSIEYIKQELIDSYIALVLGQRVNKDVSKEANLKVVYTPLNGTGNKPVRRVLSEMGITDVTMVQEQEMPDGNFTTCSYPNPEIKESLQLGIDLCTATNADILLATDPDADRVGIAVPHEGEYKLISGNEVGVLMLDYIARCRTLSGNMPKNPIAVKSIVTTGLANRVGANYGIEVIDVLTGFKYIGEQIAMLEENEQEDRFLLGFEESYGYLTGTFVRDKDAVIASMLICEMASYFKKVGSSIYIELQKIYEKYGRYIHKIGNFSCEGASGMEQMKNIMSGLRENPPSEIGALKVLSYSDYAQSVTIDCKTNEKTAINLPKSNVLLYNLEENCSVIIRPSGTEPKIKAYYTVVEGKTGNGDEIFEKIRVSTEKLLGF